MHIWCDIPNIWWEFITLLVVKVLKFQVIVISNNSSLLVAKNTICYITCIYQSTSIETWLPIHLIIEGFKVWHLVVPELVKISVSFLSISLGVLGLSQNTPISWVGIEQKCLCLYRTKHIQSGNQPARVIYRHKVSKTFFGIKCLTILLHAFSRSNLFMIASGLPSAAPCSPFGFETLRELNF